MAVAGAWVRPLVALLVGLGALAIPAAPAGAATSRTWVGPGNGAWSTPSNWSPAGVPQAGDDIVLGSSGSVFDMPGLSIRHLQLTGGSLNASSGAGSLTVTGDVTAGSYAFIFAPLVLGPGPHEVSVAEQTTCCQYLQLDKVSGPGDLVAEGPGRLLLRDLTGLTGSLRAAAGADVEAAHPNQLSALVVEPGSHLTLLLRQDVGWPITVPAGAGLAANVHFDASSVTLAGPVALGSDVRLTAGSYDAVRFTGAISGSGGLVIGQQGPYAYGRIAVTGANSFTGGTHVEPAGRVVGSGTAPFAAGPIDIGAGGKAFFDGVPSFAGSIAYNSTIGTQGYSNYDVFLTVIGDTTFHGPIGVSGAAETYIHIGSSAGVAHADVEFAGGFTSSAQLGLIGSAATATFSGPTSVAHLGVGHGVEADLAATAGSGVVVGEVWSSGGGFVHFRRAGQHDPTKGMHVFQGGTIDLWGTDQTASSVDMQHSGWLHLGLFDEGLDAARLTVNGTFLMYTASGDLGVTFVLGAGAHDQIRAQSVVLGGDFWFFQDGTPAVGQVFRIIDNVGAAPVQGTFAGVPEGEVFQAGPYLFRISYVGGTGNDVTLTRLPGVVSTWGYDAEPLDHGGTMRGAPSVSSWGVGRVDGWVVGGDRQVWHRWQSGSSGAWEPLGGISLSSPAGVSQQPGQADVLIRGADNALWLRSYRTGWSGWQSLGGTITEAPAVTSSSPGHLAVAARGGDGGVWLRRMVDGVWQPWFPLGGRTDSAPAITDWGDGRLDVWIRGLDGALWQQTIVGSSAQGWRSHGGFLTDGPAVASSQPGDVLVVVRGGDGLVYERSWEGTGWSAWRGFDLPVEVRPAVTGAGAGDMYLAIRSPSGSLWTWHASQDWSSLASASDAAAASAAGAGGTDRGSSEAGRLQRGNDASSAATPSAPM